MQLSKERLHERTMQSNQVLVVWQIKRQTPEKIVFSKALGYIPLEGNVLIEVKDKEKLYWTGWF